MALLWAAATTVALGPPGCFRPDFPVGAACAPGDQCPDGLECTAEGICCPPGEPACSRDGDGAPADAGPDADPRAFTDFLEAYECDDDTLMLVHFDGAGGQFLDACGGPTVGGVETSERAAGPDGFAEGAQLNFGDPFTRYVQADGAALGPHSEYTVEVWVEVRELPMDDDIAVIASTMTVGAVPDIEAASWLVGVDAQGKLAILLFASDCESAHPLGMLTSEAPIAPSAAEPAPSHFRLTVAPGELRLFINGIAEPAVTLDAPFCTDPSATKLRLGGIDRGTQSTFDRFIVLAGVLDEFRLSSVAR
jgi:hypothetical protein